MDAVYLTEGPETQSLIERIADRFISAASHKGAETLHTSLQYEWNDLIPEDLGGTTVREAIPQATKRHWSQSSLAFILWLRHTHLRMFFTARLPGALATYTSGRFGFGRQPEIAVKLTSEDFRKILDGKKSAMEIYAVLRKYRRSIVHEFTHAYDDFQSAGKYTANKRHADAVDARRAAQWSNNPDNVARADALYLNDPIEVNARYTDAVSHLEPNRLQMSWRNYAQAFIWDFRGWKALPPEMQRRLTTRLAAQWQEGRDTKPKPDYRAAVKRLQGRLREMTGIEDLWLSYSENGRRDHVIGIDRFGTKDPATVDAILKAATRVADVLGMTVATGEMSHGPETASHGFVNQRSKRHKDFALPLGTQVYRRPREWKARP